MDNISCKARLIGGLVLAALLAGIFSIVPAIDSADYLSEAAKNSSQTMMGALFQFLMALFYLAIAVLLFPILEKFGKSLAIGFLALRILAATLVVFGTILLSSILALSQQYIQSPPQNLHMFEVIGATLKAARDSTNHVYMILALCSANALMFILFVKSRLLPLWISLWGLTGAVFTGIASILILFQVVDVISVQYLALNVPAALLEIVFAVWLLVKGFKA